LHLKKIVLAGILGGILLLATSVIFSGIATSLAPYNIFDIPGMRPMSDPVSSLFFAAPFVVAFVSAIVYDIVNPALSGGTVRKGIVFGYILFLLVVLPSLFVVFSSMYFPDGFYIAGLLNGVIGYPLFGILCALLWTGTEKLDFRAEAARI
jgi:hypothetical protein